MSEVVIDIRTVGVDKIKQAADEIAGVGRVSEEMAGKLSYANRLILRQVEADNKLAATKKKLQKAVDSKFISQGKMNTAMKEAHRLARESVVTDKEAVRIAKDRAKAEKKKSDEIERLRRKHDAAYRVQQEQNKLIQEYNLLLSQGHITLKEHAHLVDRATKEVKEFNAALVKGGNQFGKFDQQAYKSAQTLKRRFNQGVQQAGYQVGDFFVQIQSGTDILVALGQQGSQLALVFGKHGPMIGAFLAIGTAMATLVIQTLKATSTIKEFDDVIDDLEDSSSKLESLYDMMIAKPEEVAAKHKLAREELLELIRTQAKYEKREAEQAITTSVAAGEARGFVKTPVGLGAKYFSDPTIARKLGVEPAGGGIPTLYFGEILKQFSQAQKELFEAYRVASEELVAAEDIGPEAQRTALNNLLEVVERLGVEAPLSLDKFNAELAEAAERASETAKNLESVNAELNRQNLMSPEFGVALEDLAAGRIDIGELLPPIEAYEKSREAAEYEEERKESQNDFLRGLMQEASFWDAMNGKNLEEIEEFNEARKLHNKLIDLGLKPTDRLYLNAVKYTAEAKANKEEAEAMAEAIKEASSSFESLLNQSSGIGVEIAKVEAQIEATKTGADVATAAYIAGERAKITATAETTKALALQTGNLILLAESAIAYTEAMAKLDKLAALKETLADLKGAAGGGGGKSSGQDPLAKLRERIKLDTELLGKTKERQEVEQAIANSTVEYSKEAVDSVVAQLQAYNQLVEKQQEVQGLYDTAQSALEDSFMSIVDGTKSVEDAFKDMARSIISELYKVLVVQKMVGSFDASTGASSGIMGFLGNLKIFDGGGYTGSGSRSGGLDGRGGYLAMVHPRETVIDHTKAGSPVGENITVVQNFSFQANGDDSVKRIIAQAAPSIANMAKQSVMDARRRGGAMKSTFG